MRTNWKLVFFLLSLTFILLKISAEIAHATPPTQAILLINQVRGTECCDEGISEALELQISTMQKQNLKGTFALRYDAVLNKEIISLIKKAKASDNEISLFLEITPALLKASGVESKGPSDRWYKAQYAYLLGYTPQERIKIIDTAFETYKSVFAEYPKTTVAWMIDADSLRYMHEKYEILAHELTREQLSLDSYTLYGGVPTGGFFPSKNWALIPASSKETALPVLIVRQTATDPLFTYGDFTSTTTSQPNDYLQGKRDFSYFQKILDSGLSAKPYGLAVIGLENSMVMNPYQHEFVRQLEHIGKLSQNQNVKTYSLLAYAQTFTTKENKFFLSSRSESDKQAFWVTTPTYRVRVIRNGNDVRITDLRIYDDRFQDPYKTHPLLVSDATWVVPYVLDGSRSFSPIQSSSLTNFIADSSKPKTNLIIANDFDSQPSHIPLASIASDSFLESTFATDVVTVRYIDSAKRPVTLNFLRDRFEVEPPIPVDKTIQDPKLKNELEILIEGKTDKTVLTPKISVNRTDEQISTLPRSITPEFIMGDVDLTTSIAQFPNRFTIIGKTPVRIVLRLRDTKNHPTLAKQHITVTSQQGNFDDTIVHYPQVSDGEYFVDISHSVVGKFNPKVIIDDKEWILPTIHFVRDCRLNATECLRHPDELIKYTYTKISDRLRKK